MENGNGSSISEKADPWELNAYEKQRKPHEPITDPDVEIVVNPRSLMAELMCPICLDILKNTMTAKECMHRFCHDCITTALRSTNKECPTCRKKLVSRRSLRPDPNFDDLISKLYPDREEYEASQEQIMAVLSQDPSTQALQRSIEEGMKMQAEIRKHRKLRMVPAMPTRQQSCPTVPASSVDIEEGHEDSNADTTPRRRRGRHSREGSFDPTSASEASSSGIVGTMNNSKEVELVLRVHPAAMESTELQAMQDRYLKTSAIATIAHLMRYLAVRVSLDQTTAQSVKTEEGESEIPEEPSNVHIIGCTAVCVSDADA